MNPAIWMTNIRVRKDRIAVEVQLANRDCAYTTPELVRRLMVFYPHLLSHACVNAKGDTFEAVAFDTSLPHLLEHMVIEEQVRLGASGDAADASRVYVGKTSWVDRRRLSARVEVSYADDLLALHAFRIALERLNGAMVE